MDFLAIDGGSARLDAGKAAGGRGVGRLHRLYGDWANLTRKLPLVPPAKDTLEAKSALGNFHAIVEPRHNEDRTLPSLSLDNPHESTHHQLLLLLLQIPPIMAPPRSVLQYLCSLVLFFACAQALKFDLQAVSQSHDSKKERCIRNFVAKDTLVVVTATVSGTKGDGMRLNMHVSALSSLSFLGGTTGRAGLCVRVRWRQDR